MIIFDDDGKANTNKILPPPPMAKAEETEQERETEREQVILRRGQSSRSYMEAPPPSYEAVERVLEPQLSLIRDTSFQFIRPPPSSSVPRLELPNHEPPLSPASRTPIRSTSYSNLRPYNDTSPSHSIVPPNRTLTSYASTPTLNLRPPEAFSSTSPGSPISTATYGHSTTTLSTAPYSSTLSINTILPQIPPITPSPSSNSSLLQVPTFIPSTKKSFFSTQSGNKKRNAKEARQFVLSQVSHLLQNQTTPEYNVDTYKRVLRSCAEACSSHSLSLSAILQEKNVEEHTPFYWSIVQRASSTPLKMPELLQALLVFGVPLTEDTRIEVGRACLMVNDPKLYQALRVSKYFMGQGAAEGTLSSNTVFKDRVVIKDTGGGPGGGHGEFAATLEIPRYKERTTIQIEFIAQRRLWRLTIRKTSDPRKWKIGIGLLEQSPATYVDSRFILQSLDASPTATRTSSAPPSPAITYSDYSDTMSSTASNPAPSALAPHSYGYGVQSASNVAGGYPRYPPERSEMTRRQQPLMLMPRPRTNSAVTIAATSIRKTEESFFSLPRDGGRGRGLPRSPSNWSINGENANGGGDATTLNGNRNFVDRWEGGDEEFSLSSQELPFLPWELAMKEVRLKSNSMLSAGKKDIESEIEVDVTDGGGEESMRARFEARLAKPESECIIC